jgi:hypothetical protein
MSVRQACDVASRTSKTCDESGAYGVGFGHEHDGHGAGHLLGSHGAAGRRRNEDIDFEMDELGCQRREALDPSSRISFLDDSVLTFGVPKLVKPFLKCSDPPLGLLESFRDKRQITYPPDLSRVLRSPRGWHRKKARQAHDEIPTPHHSLT